MVVYEFRKAVLDLKETWNRRNLAFLLGWLEIKKKYRRSKLGPFWLTISMAVMIVVISFIFSKAMHRPLEIYLPFVASGYILWNFVSNSIKEGIGAYISSGAMIRQMALPLGVFPLRCLWKNVIVLGHNVVVIPVVFIFVQQKVSMSILLLIPGFALVCLNLYWMSMVGAIFCTRFRDMPPIISSIIQVFFYLTPILWMPDRFGGRVSQTFIDINPFYHLIELMRSPLLGSAPSILSWGVSSGMCIIGYTVALYFFAKYRGRIAYWV